MNAIEKYTAKKKLTAKLVKSAQVMAALKGLSQALGAAGARAGARLGAAKTPAFLGKTLGGQPLAQAYRRGMGAMARNPGRTALGAAGLGGATFLAGRASKG